MCFCPPANPRSISLPSSSVVISSVFGVAGAWVPGEAVTCPVAGSHAGEPTLPPRNPGAVADRLKITRLQTNARTLELRVMGESFVRYVRRGAARVGAILAWPEMDTPQ